MADGPIIALEDVRKSYDRGRSFAVDSANLGVIRGEFVAVVGQSGSGKTTLLKMINRLTEVGSGSVSVEGQSVKIGAPSELRRKIGYVFQGVGLFPHMTIGENIAITPRLLGWAEPDIAPRIVALLDMVGLSRDYVNRFPNALSGGERQRVGFARALAARPQIVLMDEPFGALDPITRDILGQTYRALHDQLHLTTLMVTHDITEALLLADRIVVMDKGHIVADAAPGSLMAGHPDSVVKMLMSTPRRQAERLSALLASKGGGPHG